ncbi:MAG: hypothetical protein KTR14_02145 [Vampirovibrio sp.]|nr:hypothetical protein [Vampirovibrio sp.]
MSQKTKGILQLIGPRHAGKTTLCELFLQEFSAQHILAVDATQDQGLSYRLTLDNPPKPVSGLIDSLTSLPPDNHEAIDWAFHDLVHPVKEEADLLLLGNLSQDCLPGVLKKLTFGFTRLLDSYDYVVIDGSDPFLTRCLSHLPPDLLQTVVVVSPSTTQQEWGDLSQALSGQSPALVLNYATEASGSSVPVPVFIEQALEAGDFHLVGKLPTYASAEDRIKEMPEMFKNCLLRLELALPV